MSTAFTTIAAEDDAQSLAMANELVLAYSERRQAIGQSAVSALDADDDAQDKTLWLAMQNWCETYCTSFVDHVNGPLNGDSSGFLYFTVATWRAAAGLNASGFTRKYGSPGSLTTDYGVIQADDVRGVWNFQELQLGLSVLLWTAIDDTLYYTDLVWGSKGEKICANCGGAQQQATVPPDGFSYVEGLWDSRFDSSDNPYEISQSYYPTTVPTVYAWVDGPYVNGPFTYYWYNIQRSMFYPRVYLPAAVRPRLVTVYQYGQKGSAGWEYDANGDSVQEGIFTEHGTTSAETAAAIDEFVGAMIGAAPVKGTYPSRPTGITYRGYQARLSGLVKWNFTNA